MTTLTRQMFHYILDKYLDRMGYKNDIDIHYGSLIFEIVVEDGKPKLIARDRTTVMVVDLEL